MHRIIPGDNDNRPILERLRAAAEVVQAVRARQEHEARLIESAAEAMMNDPHKRGVAVERYNDHIVVYLSPYAEHGVISWYDLTTPAPVVREPSGYIGTVADIIRRLETFAPDTRLFMSGSDYGNDASIITSDYTPVIET